MWRARDLAGDHQLRVWNDRLDAAGRRGNHDARGGCSARCRDIGLPTADPSYCDDTPKYVGNEMPVVEVILHEGPEPYAEVTFQGETLVYEPTDVAVC